MNSHQPAPTVSRLEQPVAIAHPGLNFLICGLVADGFFLQLTETDPILGPRSQIAALRVAFTFGDDSPIPALYFQVSPL